MKHGDFTDLAKFYVDRPGYSYNVLNCIQAYMLQKNPDKNDEGIKFADVGAGTGKLTENLINLEIKMDGFAVEPNDAMRTEGKKVFEQVECVKWLEGAAEETNLPDSCVNWVLMGSSFHWADAPRAMKEFHRILKQGGFFTAIWNPRNIESSQLHMEIEQIVYDEIHTNKRVSSGNKITYDDMAERMMSTGYFDNMFFIEAEYEECMTVERYMNIWKSVNDIQVQAGEEGFRRILNNIENKLDGMSEITVPYRSRAWTVQVKK